jgi:type I restriction enzyme R subunit
MRAESPNLEFLAKYDAQLVRLGALAERYFRDDPNTCLIKLRQFTELIARLTAARTARYATQDEPLADLLRRLSIDRVLPRDVSEGRGRGRSIADAAP